MAGWFGETFQCFLHSAPLGLSYWNLWRFGILGFQKQVFPPPKIHRRRPLDCPNRVTDSFLQAHRWEVPSAPRDPNSRSAPTAWSPFPAEVRGEAPPREGHASPTRRARDPVDPRDAKPEDEPSADLQGPYPNWGANEVPRQEVASGNGEPDPN